MSYTLRKLTKDEKKFAEAHYYLIQQFLEGVPEHAYNDCYDAAVDIFMAAVSNCSDQQEFDRNLESKLKEAVGKRLSRIAERDEKNLFRADVCDAPYWKPKRVYRKLCA